MKAVQTAVWWDNMHRLRTVVSEQYCCAGEKFQADQNHTVSKTGWLQTGSTKALESDILHKGRAVLSFGSQ